MRRKAFLKRLMAVLLTAAAAACPGPAAAEGSCARGMTYKDHVLYKLNVMKTGLCAARFNDYEYDPGPVSRKVKLLFHRVQSDAEGGFWKGLTGELGKIWKGLKQVHPELSEKEWVQANFDRLVLVSAFELLPRAQELRLIHAIQGSISGKGRQPAVEAWRQVDRDPLGHFEGEAVKAFYERGGSHEWEKESPNTMDPGKRRILAHRGGHSRFPENSLAAFRHAGSTGLAGFECDLRLSKDHTVFVLHDRELERVTGKPGDLRELSADEVLSRRLRDPLNAEKFTRERPLTLKRLLSEFAGKKLLWLELKSDESLLLAHKVSELLEEFQAVESVIVSSFSAEMLAPFRERFPNLRVAYEFHRLSEKSLVPLQRSPDRHRLVISADHLSSLSPDLVGEIHESGMESSAYTVNRFDELRKALSGGISYIQTDRPDRAFFLQHEHREPRALP